MENEVKLDSYVGATITNIRRGNGSRSNIIYADLILADGTCSIKATLDYIVDALKEHLPDVY